MKMGMLEWRRTCRAQNADGLRCNEPATHVCSDGSIEWYACAAHTKEEGITSAIPLQKWLRAHDLPDPGGDA